MATFTKLSRSELEDMAKGQYRRHFPDGPPVRVPRHRNVGPALQLLDAERLEVGLRGRRYELLPVSLEDGLRLLRARQAVEDLEEAEPTEENILAYAEALRLVVRLARKYLKPTNPVRRLLWRMRIRGSPLKDATEAEVGQCLGFFLGCRMRSTVRYPAT